MAAPPLHLTPRQERKHPPFPSILIKTSWHRLPPTVEVPAQEHVLQSLNGLKYLRRLFSPDISAVKQTALFVRLSQGSGLC